jgi:hypothetical protein
MPDADQHAKKPGRITMLRVSGYAAMIGGFAAVLAVVAVPDASAQKRLSYEQAWAQCKKEVVAMYPSEAAGTNQRYARGMSCMQRYGYRLKRSAKSKLSKSED